MAATTGGVPRFNFSRSNTTIGHPGSTMGSAPMPKSATSAAGILDSSLGQAGSGAGGDGSGRLGYDPKLKRDKSTSSFKRHLAAARNSRNDETIRRKMALLKDQQRTLAGGRGRYTGGAKTPIQRDMEAEARNRVESELGRPVSSNDWPFVYFVVSVDQQPQQVVDGDGNGDGSARGMHTARQRQKFLVSRRRKVQEAREETERIREANIDMGLRLEPIKPQAQLLDQQQQLQRMRTRPSLSKHPTTPVSSVGSRHEFHFLNSQDDLTDLETRRSIGMIISDTLNEVGLGPRGSGAAGAGVVGSSGKGGFSNRHCPVSTLELPEISAGTKRRALGTSPAKNREDGSERKMVTFADGLPVIKGNGIPVLGVKPVDANIPQSASASCPASLAGKLGAPPRAGEQSMEEGQGASYLQPPWSAPLTLRSISSITPKSRLYTPMALPKIDIVSEIYDELIVKTIQNYLMAEGYSQEKSHQLRQTVLARLSATYPHLVKHKAWRQDPLGGDGPVNSTRDSSAVPAPGMTSAATASAPGDPQLRSRVMRSGILASRPGRSSDEPGPTSSDNFYNVNQHNVRPVNMCPFYYPTTPGQPQQPPSDFWLVSGPGAYQANGFPISPSPFMSIDGRTMTITPRLSPQSFSLGPGVNQGSAGTPRLEALPAGDAGYAISGWTPPPATANNRLPSMAEEESSHKPCTSGVGLMSSADNPTENAKPNKAEHVRTEIKIELEDPKTQEDTEGETNDSKDNEENDTKVCDDKKVTYGVSNDEEKDNDRDELDDQKGNKTVENGGEEEEEAPAPENCEAQLEGGGENQQEKDGDLEREEDPREE